MPVVTRACEWCGAELKCERWQSNRFCSLSCSSKRPKSEAHKANIGRANFGNRWPEALRQEFANRRKGEKNPNWRGGTTHKTKVLRNQREYKNWKKAVLERDQFCVQCKSEKQLEVDHIKPQYLYPELIFDVANGRVLCNPCHRETPTYGPRVKRFRSDDKAEC